MQKANEQYDAIKKATRCIEKICDWMCQTIPPLNTNQTDVIVFWDEEEQLS